MDGGGAKTTGNVADFCAVSEQFSSILVSDGRGPGVGGPRPVKDPTKVARNLFIWLSLSYQMELCRKALKENIIVYLETGSGKTHIAVCLIYEMSHLIKKPEKNLCVFLAPTVALVEQQARVIQDSIDFKVGTYCGNSKRLKDHRDWEKELEEHEVLVMTPQILLHNLSHCFIRIELIALLIFDECHYAQLESNHPYAEIMKVFYKPDVNKLPRVFGMTASPKFGKGNAIMCACACASISNLETLLHAKVYSVEDKEELEQFVNSPKLRVYYYENSASSTSCPNENYFMKLERIKHQCVSALSRKTDDHSSLYSIKKMLQRLHGNVIFCLENLGVWGALQATRDLLKSDYFERNELVEAEGQCSADSLCDKYLALASDCMKDNIEADLSSVEILREPFFSRKLIKLIGILSSFRIQPNMKCIVFVNRIVTARSLSYILGNLKVLSSWKCGFLVGVHSGLKSMSRKTTNIILEKFRSGELNLLVATKVGEEGLDIQTCCLVIRFDLPETVASFIQSRGRARMPQSEYAFLVDCGNQKELNLVGNLTKDEDQMNKEIASRKASVTSVDFEERTYKVDSTGATISSVSSVSLLHHYCSKLPRDEFFNPRPLFFYFDETEGSVCHIILPANAPMHQIVSAPQPSVEAAKKDACLKACSELHNLGALTDYLLPDHDLVEEPMQDFSDSESLDDEDSRQELHEMLVPAILKGPWEKQENTVCLSSYFAKFSPHPVDRSYKEFGIFLKKPLPGEAESMKLDLRLARGRSVMTELVPYGFAKFDEEEIILSEKFQEMCLKVILDRSELIGEHVSLGKSDCINSSSPTFYLMLPVIRHTYKNSLTIDWKLVRRCLSSSIFRTSKDAGENAILDPKSNLHLANGLKSKEDVVGSLVYAPCKNTFFFVSDVVLDKNGYSRAKDSINHVDHYVDVFGIHLSYPDQPLLKAKQLFHLDNLLRKKGHSESREKEEHFVELPPEICQLKITGFSKDIGSSLSLLPSIMQRLESLLVAIELKHKLSTSFPEGSEVTASRVLEALTTEKCNEHFSLERLEVLGDAFLKFAVGRQLFLLHDALDEGLLTRKRSNLVNNSHLLKLATLKNLQVYIRDQSFEPCLFFALGRPCPVICSKETETSIHSSHEGNDVNGSNAEVICSRSHRWLHKKSISDVVEALVGAFIVDSGFKATTAFLKWIGINVDFQASQVNNICSASTIFMSLADRIDIAALESILGYQFLHKGLLVQAFLHPSYNKHAGGCYQRLEFLGDAVLDYLITSYLYSVYPNLKPGQLTDLRSVSVNNKSFADIAVHRSFQEFIICDSSSLCESMSKYVNFVRASGLQKGLVEAPCPKVLGDLVESSIGAILLDTGFNLNRVWNIMLSFLTPITSFSKLQLNPVRELRELCQSHNWNVQFPAIKKDRLFAVEAKVSGNGVSETACATNLNRKTAKNMAAKQLCSKLKAQGYKARSKSLEEVLRSSQKMEAKLIGYDEKPTDVLASYPIGFEKLAVHEPSRSNGHLKVHPVSVEPKKVSKPNIGPVRQPPSSSKFQFTENIESHGCSVDSQTPGGSGKGSSKSAKSRLYEICAANCWKPPLFDCCVEAGPSHLKEFIFKVSMEIEENTNMILECIGDPRAKKKDAAEHAAEGALWYLKREGYLEDKDRD
ncbi:hypothetical protein RJ640_009484 [Escallonia rubra]|uniref:Dicer-like protein 4 n=1 Tax=Escallonia rubra TaxID=112253 RepID=A0AA88RXL3_9ASTE|nr:hypothetical protein RJ640_009484 [Escallonia rubra]